MTINDYPSFLEGVFAAVALLGLAFVAATAWWVIRHWHDGDNPPWRVDPWPDSPPDWLEPSAREMRLLDRVDDLEKALAGAEDEKVLLYETLEERNTKIADLTWHAPGATQQ